MWADTDRIRLMFSEHLPGGEPGATSPFPHADTSVDFTNQSVSAWIPLDKGGREGLFMRWPC